MALLFLCKSGTFYENKNETANTSVIISFCGTQNTVSLRCSTKPQNEEIRTQKHFIKKQNRNESTWIKALCFSDFFYRTQIHTRHFHKAFAYHQSIQVLFQYVPLEGSSYSKVVLVAEQLVYEVLKQWTACHPCYSSCVFSCIKIHLRLNYALYFHFFLRRLTFKCIITDQSPKLDNINRSFLAICKEITSSTILERENEIYNQNQWSKVCDKFARAWSAISIPSI